MRVLFFNYEYPPLGGGAANATEYILREYAKMPDLEVDLVTSSLDNEYHLEKIGDNIRIHKLPIGKNKDNLHYQSQKELMVYALKAYFFSRKLTSEHKFDLTHSFFTVPCGAVSWLLWITKKIPYVVSLRGSDVPGYSERFKFIYSSISFLFKDIWRKSGAVISNSQGLKELALKTKPNQEIGIIYNGIDTENFKPSTPTPEYFYITLGGTRITQRKGIRYLIEAIKKIEQAQPQIRMNVVGDGDEKSSLEKMVQDLGLEEKIKFIGRVPHEEILKYYNEASLFVLPSLNEGMSNAMLEALACGLPIISTNTGGADELVKDGKNGFIVKMKDSEDLAEKIRRIVSNSELKEKMSRESRKLAENMSWRNVANQYADLYKKILNEK